ncbi:hypothetical protein Herbaro_11295 [Herbaspirillum sp. WKF16]|uniref:hypothetical protein n=1 Tax=Herbaspirillum sp. WKF16 TaxID=3028312 RepID=UPI0023A9B792|nr:hypothetical protein [Herbaspirillum sp. WKF16]WDZ98344.1 hypothetical protein Herbaro_11295 [Herbaspirillum sp. WKF16]
MIFHASIPARDPRHVARVLAELWGGFAAPFPSFPGAWMAVSGDDRGTIIECYPGDRVIAPGFGQGAFDLIDADHAQYSGFHLAVGSSLDAEQVLALGHREGWRAVRGTRGQNFFDVIEVWIENTTLIEVLTQDMQAQYRSFATPANFRALGAAAAG